jgi:hypothetical protein
MGIGQVKQWMALGLLQGMDIVYFLGGCGLEV